MNDSDADHILLDLTMSNALFNAVPLPNDAMTFQKWKPHMMVYIMSTKDSYILWKDHLVKNSMDLLSGEQPRGIPLKAHLKVEGIGILVIIR